ncbi:MAG: DUF6261 family protein [Tannerellaceae bacterium]|nr:DUF6261 family protein [Tannerellaceae bacterium]
MKVKNCSISQMRQQQAFEFYNKAIKYAKYCRLEQFQPYITALEDANKALDLALTPIRKSQHTETIVAEDEKRDRTWRALRATVNAQLLHFHDTNVSIAKRADDILNTYGDPTKKAYTEETGILKNLVTDLEEMIVEANQKRIGIDELVKELKRANEWFTKLLTNREGEKAFKETGISKTTRQAADNAYRNMVEALNSIAFLEADFSKVQDAINLLNQIIDQENAVMKARATRRTNKKGNEDSAFEEE